MAIRIQPVSDTQNYSTSNVSSNVRIQPVQQAASNIQQTLEDDRSVIKLAKDYLSKEWKDATSSKENILKTVGNILVGANKAKETFLNPTSMATNYATKATKNIQQTIADTKDVKSTGKESAFGTAGNIATAATRGFLGQAEGVADLLQYGIAGGAELVGAKKTKEWFMDAAKMNTTDRLLKTAQEYYNPRAYQGFKQGQVGSQLAEGVGGVAANIGMAGLGSGATSKVGQAVAQYAPIFASSTGSGISEGLNTGADTKTSVAYGLGKGIIETLSEMAFGGIAGTGKGALDDKLVNIATRGITSEVKKRLATMGIKGAFEGLEENISGALTPILQRMTIDPNAKMYWQDENGKFTLTKAGLDFLLAATTSAIAQSALPTPIETQTPTSELTTPTQTNTQDNINIPTTQQTSQGVAQMQPQEQVEQIFKKIENDRQGLKINYNPNIGENGVYTKNADGTRNITINPNSPKAIEFVLVHELSHDLANTPEYNTLKQTILDYDKGIAGFQEARANLTSMYKDVYTKQILQNNPNITQQDLDIELNKMIDEEATNDVLGTMLSDQTYINKLSTQQPNVFQKIYRWINDMLKRISGKESKFLQDVKLKFENAYRQQNVSQIGTKLSKDSSTLEKQKYLERIDRVRYDKRNNGNFDLDIIDKNGDLVFTGSDLTIVEIENQLNPDIANKIEAGIGSGFGTTKNIYKEDLGISPVEISAEDKTKIRNKAKKEFGTTSNIKEAGYLTTDGYFLDFSGKRDGGSPGTRGMDHREINSIGYDMEEFINQGNIRMKPEGNGFEFSQPLTEPQKKMLRYFINQTNGNVFFDIPVGKYDYVSAEYKQGTSPDKIFNDIDYYFKNNKLPEKSLLADFRYSLSKTDIDKKWQERLNKVYEPAGIQNKKQTFKPIPTIAEIKQPTITPQDTTQEEAKNNLKLTKVEDIINTPISKIPTPGVLDTTRNLEETFKGDNGKKIINEFKDNQVSYGKDIYRNIEDSFGKNANVVKKQLLQPFDNSKLKYVNLLKTEAKELKNNIKSWNIKKGSKDSALIQKYGEKLITLDELKNQTNNWENVVKADKYFRNKYDELIDLINASRQQIYPNVEKNIEKTKQELIDIDKQIKVKEELLKSKVNKKSKLYSNIQTQIDNLKFRKETRQNLLSNEDLFRGKRIPKRADYYRHFQEMAGGGNGLVALVNVLTSPNDISSSLAGVSEFTKPSSKFASIFQKRTGNKTTYDAVGGFLNYLPTASYAINIDPNIKNFRDFGKILAENTKDNPKANKMIEYLNDYANDLAGKTNPADRFLQKVVGRKGISLLRKISGRIKSNAVLGNVGSSLSQVLNLPNGIADVENPVYLAKGFKDTVAKALSKDDAYADSQFISERYLNFEDQFDTKLIDQPKKLAKWMLTALDEVSTKFIWNSEYNKAIGQGIEDPINYADNQTRKMVAGRGIGEMTLAQKSNVISTFMPFTVEVGNSLRVMKGFAKTGRIDKLLILFIMNYLINKGIKEVGGSGSAIDPIQTIIDVANEKDTNWVQKLGRVGGEILSNIPGGQQLAALYPEYGATIGSITTPTRKELFGKNDPTRFGTGNIFTKAAESPLTSVITPFGGSQINKTIKGIKGLTAEIPGGYSKSGLLQYPIEPTPSNIAKGILFGNFNETQDYYDKNRRTLSEKQFEALKQSANIKADYEALMKVREYNKLVKEIKELQKNGKDTTKKEAELNALFK